jgi:hypothetical protein
MRYPLVVSLCLSCSFVYGAENCSQIENTQDRLACFDRQFPRMESESITPSEAGEVSAKTESVDTKNTGTSSSEPAAVISQPKEEKKGWFNREKEVITATITEVLNEDRQKMVFRLSNKQIWLQSSPRSLPINIGDEVTIKSGMIGGFIMRSSSGTSTRVQLID